MAALARTNASCPRDNAASRRLISCFVILSTFWAAAGMQKIDNAIRAVRWIEISELDAKKYRREPALK